MLDVESGLCPVLVTKSAIECLGFNFILLARNSSTRAKK